MVKTGSSSTEPAFIAPGGEGRSPIGVRPSCVLGRSASSLAALGGAERGPRRGRVAAEVAMGLRGQPQVFLINSVSLVMTVSRFSSSRTCLKYWQASSPQIPAIASRQWLRNIGWKLRGGFSNRSLMLGTASPNWSRPSALTASCSVIRS